MSEETRKRRLLAEYPQMFPRGVDLSSRKAKHYEKLMNSKKNPLEFHKCKCLTSLILLHGKKVICPFCRRINERLGNIHRCGNQLRYSSSGEWKDPATDLEEWVFYYPERKGL